MVGFNFWIVRTNLTTYTIVWVVIMLVFIGFMIVMFYVGGKDRRRLEKELIAENGRRQEAMLRKK